MALEATLKSVESLLRDVVSHQLEAAIETKLDGVKSDVDKMGAHSSKLFGINSYMEAMRKSFVM